MPVNTNEPTRRSFPVYFLIDASGSMKESGKWKVLTGLLESSIRQLKLKPDPDFEIIIAVVSMQGGGVVIEHEPQPVRDLELRSFDTSGIAKYSLGLETIADLIDQTKVPVNSYQPCIVLVGDGYVDEDFEAVVNKLLKRERFKASTRMVVEIGNDFNSASLHSFVSSPNNFFTVRDVAVMPLFYMRLASSINSQAVVSRSRRLLAD